MKSPFLVGRSLYLRPVTEADVTERYVAWLNDPDVTKYMGWRAFPSTAHEISDYVRSKRRGDSLFLALIVRSRERHIGNIHLGPIDWVHRRAELSMMIGDKTAWGKGYMTEAFNLVITHAFKTLHLNKLKAGTEVDNTASVKVFHKTGWLEEGTLRRETFRDGAYRDILLFARFNGAKAST
ncbi:MAG TPA: GNAT family N-acetyltransferase [Planctomycetota bacterium]|jgi:RimJ/RimL family protein N-acetyltransferase|nr:GNAT family N-acetyltransferase [Planctomycetota bacterium]